MIERNLSSSRELDGFEIPRRSGQRIDDPVDDDGDPTIA
jgi:hypothetical protein